MLFPACVGEACEQAVAQAVRVVLLLHAAAAGNISLSFFFSSSSSYLEKKLSVVHTCSANGRDEQAIYFCWLRLKVSSAVL